MKARLKIYQSKHEQKKIQNMNKNNNENENQMQSPASMGGASAGQHKCLVGVAPRPPLPAGKPNVASHFAWSEYALFKFDCRGIGGDAPKLKYRGGAKPQACSKPQTHIQNLKSKKQK